MYVSPSAFRTEVGFYTIFSATSSRSEGAGTADGRAPSAAPVASQGDTILEAPTGVATIVRVPDKGGVRYSLTSSACRVAVISGVTAAAFRDFSPTCWAGFLSGPRKFLMSAVVIGWPTKDPGSSLSSACLVTSAEAFISQGYVRSAQSLTSHTSPSGPSSLASAKRTLEADV